MTLACFLLAMLVNGIDAILCGDNWAVLMRSDILTTTMVLLFAIPISRAVGLAHLQLHHAKRAAEELSRTDQLTGLPNRRVLLDAFEKSSRATLSLVVADIDRFKRVNDHYGHLAGDQVIAAIARVMRAQIGDFGLLARLGGEEFAILCENVDRDALFRRLEAMRETLAATPIVAAESRIVVTVSAGVAVSRGEANFERLYAEADRALYAAKAAGRNRVLFIDEVEATASCEPAAA